MSYVRTCSYRPRSFGCYLVTDGYLSRSGAEVTWGSQVPLGQPFTVREPLWAWGTGRTLSAGGDGWAIPTIVAGLFFDGATLLLLYALVVIVRHSRRSPEPARGDPGVRLPQHPDHPGRGHHGSGVHHPARRGAR